MTPFQKFKRICRGGYAVAHIGRRAWCTDAHMCMELGPASSYREVSTLCLLSGGFIGSPVVGTRIADMIREIGESGEPLADGGMVVYRDADNYQNVLRKLIRLDGSVVHVPEYHWRLFDGCIARYLPGAHRVAFWALGVRGIVMAMKTYEMKGKFRPITARHRLASDEALYGGSGK